MARSILLVDDDASTRRALSSVLRSRGYDVEVCEGPELALASLRARSYDVLLTDQVMHGIAGLELARRALALQPDVRCFVLSGHFPPPAAECAHVVWLMKPMDIAGLRDAIEARFEDASARTSP